MEQVEIAKRLSAIGREAVAQVITGAIFTVAVGAGVFIISLAMLPFVSRIGRRYKWNSDIRIFVYISCCLGCVAGLIITGIGIHRWLAPIATLLIRQ